MPRISFVHPSGAQDDLELPVGMSVMHGATNEGIEGIIGECGGNAMCATCHVYVDPEHTDRLPPVSPEEDALLDGTACERRENSRLCCQIEVTPELEGLSVCLPRRQI